MPRVLVARDKCGCGGNSLFTVCGCEVERNKDARSEVDVNDSYHQFDVSDRGYEG